MSLINEALKKAQKLRSGDPAAAAPIPGSGNTRITKRAEPRSTQQLVLIAAGALALIVLSVVATFWFVNRTPAPKPAPKPIAVKPADAAAPSPTIVAPAIKPPVVAPEPAPPARKSASTPVVEQSTPGPTETTTPVAAAPVPPATKPAASEKVAESPAPQTTTPAANPPAATPTATPPPASVASVPTATDPRVQAFIDGVKVKGILPSGTDSRVLMSDRVFRVNDIVERNLGVRLTKVEANALTFTDANGAVYVKNF